MPSVVASAYRMNRFILPDYVDSREQREKVDSFSCTDSTRSYLAVFLLYGPISGKDALRLHLPSSLLFSAIFSKPRHSQNSDPTSIFFFCPSSPFGQHDNKRESTITKTPVVRPSPIIPNQLSISYIISYFYPCGKENKSYLSFKK